MKRITLCLTALAIICLAGPAPAQDDFAAQREAMVMEQIEPRGVENTAVLRAMRTVPRHRFVPPAEEGMAYRDTPLPIGFGQTISQPYIVAYMSEQLRLKGGEKVLEIGTGSGYQAAVLAQMGAKVYSVEIIPQLHEAASKRLDDLGYGRVALKLGDGYYGWEEQAPFDRIIVTCAAAHIPPPLAKQLAKGGRMVIPVGEPMFTQQLVLAEKDDQGRMRTQGLMLVRFVPLVHKDQD